MSKSSILLLAFLIRFFVWGFDLFAQSKLPTGVLPSPGLPSPVTPKFPDFEPVTSSQRNGPSPTLQKTDPLQQFSHDSEIREQNIRKQNELIQEAFSDFKVTNIEAKAGSQHYWAALEQLQTMTNVNDTSFSLTDAVFLIENAYFDNKLPADKFKKLIEGKVALCKYIMQKERLNPNDELAKHYAIQKVFSGKISKYDPKTKATKIYSPFKYDFKDYMGQQHWENMFVSKLLLTGSGQCHSMPLMYLILAEQLGVKANLSLAPEHSYIKFYDEKGTGYNFETTNGMLVSDKWLMRSGYINANAIKNKIYLDTLDHHKLLGYLLVDLALGYMEKFGYDDFVNQSLKAVKDLYPNNLQALMIEANLTTAKAMQAIKAAGSPPPEKLKHYPEAYNLYKQMHTYYRQIDDLGYQQMPAEEYRRWLSSLQEAKQKQESQGISNMLKNNMKIKININPKPN